MNLIKTIGAMSINEVLAILLAFGQQRFVAGPMMMLAELIGNAAKNVCSQISSRQKDT